MNPQNKNIVDPEVARAEISKQLGIEHLADDQKEDIISGVLEACMQQATTIILSQLPEDGLKKVDALLDAGEMDALQAYVQKNVPNTAQIIDDVIRVGVEEYRTMAAEQQ